MKRIWLLSIVLLAVAAVEFGALGAASAGASFLPGWLAANKDGPAEARTANRSATPVSPPSQPSCKPDREHAGDGACDRDPASIQFTPDPLVIHCDGTETSTLTVRVTDAQGRAVPDGTTVYFWAYNGNTVPYTAKTDRGVVTTSVSFYSDIFPPGSNVNVEVGPLQAGIRIRCFPESNQPPSPPCAVGSPPASPPCATPTPPPCSVSPPSLSPPCATPTPWSPPSCNPWPSPPSVSPPCATPTPWPTWPPTTPCPTTSPSSGPVCGDSALGSATIAVNAPVSPQAGGVPFNVPIDLTSFTPGTATTWAGYDLELAYDATMLQPTGSARGLCSADAWANPDLAPRVVSGCAFQSNTTTGTLETITFACLREGSSTLHLVPLGAPDRWASGTNLFDVDANPFALTLIDGSITCASAATGGATVKVSLDRLAHVTGEFFPVAIDLTQFTPVTSATWAGYELELAYDTTILQATSDTRGLCSEGLWANPALAPHIVSGCFGQASTATGTLDTITFVCLKEGVSPLHLVRPGASDALMAGTSLFDVNANPFVVALRDDEVFCGAPTPATLTPSPLSPTPTPTAAACLPLPGASCETPTPTPTATPTPKGRGIMPFCLSLSGTPCPTPTPR